MISISVLSDTVDINVSDRKVFFDRILEGIFDRILEDLYLFKRDGFFMNS